MEEKIDFLPGSIRTILTAESSPVATTLAYSKNEK